LNYLCPFTFSHLTSQNYTNFLSCTLFLFFFCHWVGCPFTFSFVIQIANIKLLSSNQRLINNLHKISRQQQFLDHRQSSRSAKTPKKKLTLIKITRKTDSQKINKKQIYKKNIKKSYLYKTHIIIRFFNKLNLQ
jgi:hypothetical protein